MSTLGDDELEDMGFRVGDRTSHCFQLQLTSKGYDSALKTAFNGLAEVHKTCLYRANLRWESSLHATVGLLLGLAAHLFLL